jgi:hypothetical protein
MGAAGNGLIGASSDADGGAWLQQESTAQGRMLSLPLN